MAENAVVKETKEKVTNKLFDAIYDLPQKINDIKYQ